ncbi:hypothetical protein ACFQ1S_30400 [Kibdelosporangium lantanae]|uniref:Uncharacterized protein n=1 Tax=Kibdelosporangium lantanae TaxID=1497396 RepID=A0ABW3MHI0_9PSEU
MLANRYCQFPQSLERGSQSAGFGDLLREDVLAHYRKVAKSR